MAVTESSSRKKPLVLICLLVLSHGIFLFAGFFAPYDFGTQNRLLAFAPPQRIHLRDDRTGAYVRPFVYGWKLRAGTLSEYEEDRSVSSAIQLFVTGSPYKLLGFVQSRQHLFGTDGSAKAMLLGTDAYGRDQLSRLLYAGRFSLFAGLLAAVISLVLALTLGGLAGFYGRWVDDVMMRIAEVFLTVPWLYLLLTIRAMLPLEMSPARVFLLLTVILGLLGWARPARLIRGVVLSAAQMDYVKAARGFGASDVYLLRRHILPYASGVALTQLALYVPQYVLAEVTLSFFGLGVSEPLPSWGNMLAGLQSYFVLQSCPWMFAPAVALTAVFFLYHRLLSFYSRNNLKF